VPEGWEVTRGRHGAQIRGPGFTASVLLRPDHGYRSMSILLRQLRGAHEGGFGGRPAAVSTRIPLWLVPLGREILQIHVQTRPGGAAPGADDLAKLLAPTLERDG
jgi:hypothetical protein